MIAEDLTPYAYDNNNEGGKAVNVGWLGRSYSIERPDFTVGDVPPEALAYLERLPVMNQYRGWHTCEFCDGWLRDGKLIADRIGNGDLRVPGLNGMVYVAPVMIRHYIREHHYRPPQEFIDAIMARVVPFVQA